MPTYSLGTIDLALRYLGAREAVRGLNEVRNIITKITDVQEKMQRTSTTNLFIKSQLGIKKQQLRELQDLKVPLSIRRELQNKIKSLQAEIRPEGLDLFGIKQGRFQNNLLKQRRAYEATARKEYLKAAENEALFFKQSRARVLAATLAARGSAIGSPLDLQRQHVAAAARAGRATLAGKTLAAKTKLEEATDATLAAQSGRGITALAMAHPYVATLTAVTALVAGIKLYTDHLKKMSIVFAQTRGSQQGMIDAFKEASSIFASTTLSMQASLEIVNKFGYAAKTNGRSIDDYAKSIEELKVGFNLTEQAATEIMESLVKTGDLTKLREKTNLGATQIADILEKLGQKSQGTVKDAQTAISVMAKAPMQIVNASLATQFGKMFKAARTEVDEMALSVSQAGGAVLKMIGGVGEPPELKAEEDRVDAIRDVNVESNNYLDLVEKATSKIEEQKSSLVAVAEKWSGILGRVHGYANAIQSLKETLRVATIGGGIAEAGMLKGGLMQMQQGNELSMGVKTPNNPMGLKDPVAAFKAYQQSAMTTASLMTTFKGAQERLTGQIDLGEGKTVYSGSRAIGREAYVLRQRQRAMIRGAGRDITEALENKELPKADRERLKEIQKGLKGSSKDVNAALEKLGQMQASKAKEVADSARRVLEQQLKETQASGKVIQEALPGILAELVQLNETKFADLSEGARKQLEKDPRYQRALAAQEAANKALAASGMINKDVKISTENLVAQNKDEVAAFENLKKESQKTAFPLVDWTNPVPQQTAPTLAGVNYAKLREGESLIPRQPDYSPENLQAGSVFNVANWLKPKGERSLAPNSEDVLAKQKEKTPYTSPIYVEGIGAVQRKSGRAESHQAVAENSAEFKKMSRYLEVIANAQGFLVGLGKENIALNRLNGKTDDGARLG